MAEHLMYLCDNNIYYDTGVATAWGGPVLDVWPKEPPTLFTTHFCLYKGYSVYLTWIQLFFHDALVRLDLVS